MLVSAATYAGRAVVRLVLLGLRACRERFGEFMGTRCGVQLLCGRRLVLAGLQALFFEPRAVRVAILPVSLAAVASSFAKATVEWALNEWNLQGLLNTALGKWVFARIDADGPDSLNLHMLRELACSRRCDVILGGRLRFSQCGVDLPMFG